MDGCSKQPHVPIEGSWELFGISSSSDVCARPFRSSSIAEKLLEDLSTTSAAFLECLVLYTDLMMNL
jgi:hypothetical protein